MEQTKLKESNGVDYIGRKREKLGLKPEHEPLVRVAEMAKQMHEAYRLHEKAQASCGMAGLTGSAKAERLGGSLQFLATAQDGLGTVLAAWKDYDDAMWAEIETDVAREKVEAEKAKAAASMSALDAEMKRLIDGGGQQ